MRTSDKILALLLLLGLLLSVAFLVFWNPGSHAPEQEENDLPLNDEDVEPLPPPPPGPDDGSIPEDGSETEEDLTFGGATIRFLECIVI